MLRRILCRLAFPWLLAFVGSGCVHVYHPLVNLQRPAVINPELRNFDGVHLMVRCLATDYTDSGDSEKLCENMRTLFEAQGAKVEVEVPDTDLPKRDPNAKRADLVLELSSKRVHYENSALQWIAFYASATMIPAVTESTFSQEVVLRDSDGFLLASDVLQGRFIRYVGLGFWGINAILDLIVRSKEEKITGSAAKDDFSRDFYAQLSQLTFQARMRKLVLHGFDEPIVPVVPVKAGPRAPANERPENLPGLGPAPAPAPIQPIVPKPIPLKKPANDAASEWESAPFPTKPSPPPTK